RFAFRRSADLFVAMPLPPSSLRKYGSGRSRSPPPAHPPLADLGGCHAPPGGRRRGRGPPFSPFPPPSPPASPPPAPPPAPPPGPRRGWGGGRPAARARPGRRGSRPALGAGRAAAAAATARPPGGWRTLTTPPRYGSRGGTPRRPRAAATRRTTPPTAGPRAG